MGLLIFSTNPPQERSFKSHRTSAKEHLRNRLCLGEQVAFLLDPDLGAVKLKPSFWYGDARVNAAFKFGYMVRAIGAPTDDYLPYDGHSDLHSKMTCKIGVRVDDTERSPTARAETLAEPWLSRVLSDRTFKKKSDYWQSAEAQFSRLSRRGFDRVWERITKRPEHHWIKKPGPK